MAAHITHRIGYTLQANNSQRERGYRGGGGRKRKEDTEEEDGEKWKRKSCPLPRFASLQRLRRNLRQQLRDGLLHRGVAAQVAFESKGLKPFFHFIGRKVETRRFQAMGQLNST
jgi:hypothetical protein